MMISDIAATRLHNQRLAGTAFESPGDVIKWLGAVQSQDYTGARWALGLRLQGLTDSDVDSAFNSGQIIRTHVMRPTWHFLTPGDVRWMLMLTGPRVQAVNSHYYRKLGLDSGLLARGNDVLALALQGGKHLTRQELRDALYRAGIAIPGAPDDSLRTTLIVMHAELDGVICSGPRRGKQFTYALLDEWVPPGRSLERDEALAELTRRYFSSHGPATVKDFVWWSGLTAADARAGLGMLGTQISSETIDGQTYWFASSSVPDAPGESSVAYFLPNFDEYTVAYADRSAIFDLAYAGELELMYPHSIVVDGRVMGGWKRVIEKNGVTIVTRLFASLTSAQEGALARAAGAYSRFLRVPVTVS